MLECAIGKYPYPEPDASGNIPQLNFWELINYIHTQPPPSPPLGSSEEMKDFLRICLGKETGSRSNVSNLLTHPFIQKNANPIRFGLWLEQLPTY